MTRETELAMRMWLEYALEGDEYAHAATGRNSNGCIAVALDLLDNLPAGWQAHSEHMAACAIDNARSA